MPPLAYVFCAMIEGNLATPLFLGRWLTLNPIAILLKQKCSYERGASASGTKEDRHFDITYTLGA